ncbi:MAG: GDP-mannose 4,6-dehydratase, partial [Candidatus Omnitrophica bacterium]|nr:GDP-mannose 4,6-dehydratase [Candidatus Omnitrophota bacterium]
MVKLLGERGYNKITIDNLSSGYNETVLYGKLIVGDVGDKALLRKIFEEYKPLAVIHFSAYLVVPESV